MENVEEITIVCEATQIIKVDTIISITLPYFLVPYPRRRINAMDTNLFLHTLTATNVYGKNDLFKRVGASSPPGEEAGEANGFEDLGDDGDTDGFERTLLLEDLGNILYRIINDCHSPYRLGGKSTGLTVGAEVARKIRPPR